LTTTDRTAPATPAQDRTSHPAYSALVGLAALGVLLQGLWAGLFIQEGKDYDSGWVSVHGLGADTTIVLALLSTVVAFVLLRRRRRDLLIGSAVFTVLLGLEGYIGGEIGKNAGLTLVHFPLAMALMGLAVWLPLRARGRA
jgi:hypothetical protein